jgi:hypothetical protein
MCPRTSKDKRSSKCCVNLVRTVWVVLQLYLMVGLLVNDEMEGIWKEAVVAQLR